MIGYLIAFVVAIASSASVFAILYAIHLRISIREDDRYLD